MALGCSLLLLLPLPRGLLAARADPPPDAVCATLGPEAHSILRVLVGRDRVVPIQPGDLARTRQTRPIAALILSEDWSNDADLDAARAAGIAVVQVKRHTSLANIFANIRLLADFTGTSQAGTHWIASIEDGLTRIRQSISDLPRVRVLVLSPEGYTQGQGALITKLIDVAGGINTAADAGIPEARQIDDTQIRDFRPEVVLLVDWTADTAVAFAANPLYRGIPAFDQDRIYRTATLGKDPARLVEDVQMLADWLHPVEF